VASARGVFGEEDVAGLDGLLFARAGIEFQAAAEGDHVLAARGVVPAQAGAGGGLFEADGGAGKADATRSTPGSNVSFVTSSPLLLEGLLPGHYGEDEHGEEHEGYHRGQGEVFVAPGRYE
jgi:hypothetical protein